MIRTEVEVAADGLIRCDACPVLCRIKEGRSGACDRYANDGGTLVRVDPFVILERAAASGGGVERGVVPFVGTDVATPGREADATADEAAAGAPDDEGGGADATDRSGLAWDGDVLANTRGFVTAIGAGTTYPDYKPAPFVVSQRHDDVDMVTVVTEGIFSYCGVKVKIDTDRHLGEERATVRARGEAVGHVTTGEYGSRMLSLGGVEHLTGGSKKQGRVTCETLLALCNREAAELEIEGGAAVTVQAGKPPVVDGAVERLMRVGCGSATIGMFARQWAPHVDEVVVVDDHITGVLSEHQAGVLLGMKPSGIRIRGAKSTPGRYFRVARPGSGWGGTDVVDPLSIVERFRPGVAWPGLRLLMVSTTGEQFGYWTLDGSLAPVEAGLPAALRVSVERIAGNCEPSTCSVLFVAGAGGSLRAGVTENPVALTRSVARRLTRVTCGGAPAYLWPGGGITLMVDVLAMPERAFGHVPTPALVAPVEFTMRRADYDALGGHADVVRSIDEVRPLADRTIAIEGPWPLDPHGFAWRRGPEDGQEEGEG